MKSNKIILNKPYIKNNSVVCDVNFLGTDIRLINEYTTINNQELSTVSEGFASLFLPHIMLTGDLLVVKGGLCDSYLKNINLLKKYYQSLDIADTHLNLKCDINAESVSNKKSISTFTGGVDSFYTLLNNFNKIDSLLFCINYDVKESQTKLLNSTLSTLNSVKEQTGKEIIICNTNQRSVLSHRPLGYLRGKVRKKYNDLWGNFLHGVCLFSHGYNLSSEYGSFYMPSTHPSTSNYLWGSSFHIDHLHSSSFLSIIPDGDCDRTEKVKKCLSENSKLFLDHLRVCHTNGKDQYYNCSKCEKCQRTILAIGLLNQEELNNLKTFNFNPSDFDNTLKNYTKRKFHKKSDIDFQNEIKNLSASYK